MNLKTDLNFAVSLDLLLTPENINKDRICKILKESGHDYFDDIEIDDDGDICYQGGYFITIYKQSAIICAYQSDRLDNRISDANLLKLLELAANNYPFIKPSITRDHSMILFSTDTSIQFLGGISEASLIESIKCFTSQSMAMRSMYIKQCMYDWDDED